MQSTNNSFLHGDPFPIQKEGKGFSFFIFGFYFLYESDEKRGGGEKRQMRVDKFLKVSRIIKRRSVANEACDAGRVMINGKVAKAGNEVKLGDIIEIQFGSRSTRVEVLDLKESTKKEDAGGMYRAL